MRALRSIRFQTIGVITCVGIMIGLVLALVMPRRAINLGQRVLNNDTRFIGGLLAENLGLGVESMDLDDGQSLHQTLSMLRDQDGRTQHALADVRVYDPQGKMLASLNDDESTRRLTSIPSAMTTEERDNIIRVSTPLYDGRQQTIGYVQIDFSKAFLQQQARSDTWFSILVALLAVFVTSLIGFFLSRSIAGPICRISVAAEAIANGDIDHKIETTSHNEIGDLAAAFARLVEYLKEMSRAAGAIAENDLTVNITPRGDKDALGISFNTMVRNLTSVMYQLSDNAESLAASAGEIGTLSDSLLDGSKNQHVQVEQVSTAIQEMAATVVESSRHAGDAANASQQAAGTADMGGQVVGDTLQAMQRIADVVTAVSTSISDLSESAAQIGGIVNVIDEVADQTNLLALNAAIEAARAGEQGRGFAVVADEVRKLAERTAKATAEISSMIKAIQEKTNGVVHTMDESIQEVKQGQEMAEKASHSLTEIVTMAQHVTDMITQIATAADEQSAAAEQISENAERISEVTKATNEGAQQSAVAAAGLNDQASSLRQLVAKFRLPQLKS